MAGNTPFHSKFHGYNHHSSPTTGFVDSAQDPIASAERPFKGTMVIAGSLSARDQIYGGPFTLNTSTNSIYTKVGSNTMNAAAYNSFIGNGTSNNVAASNAVICGGGNNTISGASGFIGAGGSNTIGNLGINSFIGAGGANAIGVSSEYCTIVGGSNNTISDESVYSTINGGLTNTLSGNNSWCPGGANLVCNSHNTGAWASKVDYSTYQSAFYAVERIGFCETNGGNASIDWGNGQTKIPTVSGTTTVGHIYISGKRANAAGAGHTTFAGIYTFEWKHSNNTVNVVEVLAPVVNDSEVDINADVNGLGITCTPGATDLLNIWTARMTGVELRYIP